MEPTAKISLTGATDEPAVPVPPPDYTPSTLPTLAATEGAVEPALDCGADIRAGRTGRHDGWTPDAIRAFLETLAECGCVRTAAKAAGLSRTSAYRLRSSTKGRAFHLAWEAAILHARRRLADKLLSCAIHGHVRTITRGGKPWLEEHRFDSRLAMAMLTRLDRIAESNHDLHRPARLAADEFSQIVDIACAEGAGAAEFVRSRMRLGDVGHYEQQVLGRAENHRDYGVGLPWEIDVSDLDPAAMADWTEDQRERARRSGLLHELETGTPRGDAYTAYFRSLIG